MVVVVEARLLRLVAVLGGGFVDGDLGGRPRLGG